MGRVDQIAVAVLLAAKGEQEAVREAVVDLLGAVVETPFEIDDRGDGGW